MNIILSLFQSLIILIVFHFFINAQSLKDVPDSLKKDLAEYFKFDDIKSSDSSNGLNIDESLYSSFKIPEFSYKEFRIGSDQIFNFSQTGDQSSLKANFTGDYKVYDQKLYSTIDYSIQPFFDFVSEKDNDPFSAVQLAIPFNLSKFFNEQYSGVQVFSSGVFAVSKIGEEDLLNPLDITLGVGYGRITSVRPIARAVALASKVGNDITNEDIIQIANIITRNNDGYYLKKYKSDAKIVYYEELAKALKAPTETMKIQQVMEDPAFSNISDRKSGIQYRAGYSNTLLTDSNNDGNITFSVDYAKPLGLDKQLIAGLGLEMVENFLEPFLNFAYTIDHSITWVSGVQLISQKTGTNFELSTTKELLNKISGKASLNYNQPEEGDGTTEFNIKLIYFAF